MNPYGYIAPLEPGGREPYGYERLIFLVHGFNNDELQASASFAKMRRSLDTVLCAAPVAESIRRSIQESIWEFYWPGFETTVPSITPTRRPRSAIDEFTTAAAYDVQVIKSREFVAEQFARYIVGLGASEVFFVGHSLGCRVILETIRNLEASAPLLIGGVCMMAAAVPVHFLQPGARLWSAANRVSCGSGVTPRRYCFYSHRDLVLLAAFAPGQIAAGEAPAYGVPIAAGLTGWPVDVWSAAKQTKFGHGGYWEGALKERLDWRMSSVFSGIFGVTLSPRLAVLDTSLWVSAKEWSLPDWRLRERELDGANWLDGLCSPL